MMAYVAFERTLNECVGFSLMTHNIQTRDMNGRGRTPEHTFLKVWRQNMGFIFRGRKEESEYILEQEALSVATVYCSPVRSTGLLFTPHFEIPLVSLPCCFLIG